MNMSCKLQVKSDVSSQHEVFSSVDKHALLLTRGALNDLSLSMHVYVGVCVLLCFIKLYENNCSGVLM